MSDTITLRSEGGPKFTVIIDTEDSVPLDALGHFLVRLNEAIMPLPLPGFAAPGGLLLAAPKAESAKLGAISSGSVKFTIFVATVSGLATIGGFGLQAMDKLAPNETLSPVTLAAIDLAVRANAKEVRCIDPEGNCYVYRPEDELPTPATLPVDMAERIRARVSHDPKMRNLKPGPQTFRKGKWDDVLAYIAADEVHPATGGGDGTQPRKDVPLVVATGKLFAQGGSMFAKFDVGRATLVPLVLDVDDDVFMSLMDGRRYHFSGYASYDAIGEISSMTVSDLTPM